MMYRIRFHGRGGQGMKTASRILGSALFIEGFEVQDAPRYGAERRGAPITAYVRADRSPINERGIILKPDLVIIADDTLVAVPAAGVLQGVSDETVLLIDSSHPIDEWRTRLNISNQIIVLPQPTGENPLEVATIGTACAAAAAQLLGVVSWPALDQAIREEVSGFGEELVDDNLKVARESFDAVSAFESAVVDGGVASAAAFTPPDWVELPTDDVSMSGPAIHAGVTSIEVRTGLWRTMRPVIEYDRCNKCNWVCGSFCPDNAISVDADGYPVIDLDHCKGCMICVVQCPTHAIQTVLESEALEKEGAEA